MALQRNQFSGFEQGQSAFFDYDDQSGDVLAVGVAVPDNAQPIKAWVSNNAGSVQYTAGPNNAYVPVSGLNISDVATSATDSADAASVQPTGKNK